MVCKPWLCYASPWKTLENMAWASFPGWQYSTHLSLIVAGRSECCPQFHWDNCRSPRFCPMHLFLGLILICILSLHSSVTRSGTISESRESFYQTIEIQGLDDPLTLHVTHFLLPFPCYTLPEHFLVWNTALHWSFRPLDFSLLFFWFFRNWF